MAKKSSKNQYTDILSFIDTWLQSRCYIDEIPGMSIALVQGDQTLFSNVYGYADIKKKQKTTEKTLYRIASISKPFTATVIMQLVEQKKLRLDDTVSTYLPWFVSKKEKQLEHITIRHLLTHTSGILRDGYTAHWEDDNFPTLEQLKKDMVKGVIVYDSLIRFKYSNLGFALLGQIIEAVSGMSYTKYMEKHILHPLGMKNTWVDLGETIPKLLATGYGPVYPGKKRIQHSHAKTNAYAAATGFMSNAIDLATFIKAQFQKNNQLLKDETKREMHRMQWISKYNETDYALGWEKWNYNAMNLTGHGGGFAGFRSTVAIRFDQEIGVAVLTNADGVWAGDVANKILNIIEYFSHKPHRKNPKLKKYEGLFQNRWGYFQTIAINGTLYGFSPYDKDPLYMWCTLEHKKGNTFVLSKANGYDSIGEEIRFEFDTKGQLTGLFSGANPMKKVQPET